MIIILSKLNKTSLKIEDEVQLLADIRQELKNSDIIKDVLKDYSYNEDILDGLKISFKELKDSSAKTVNSEIFLNKKLLNYDFEKIMRYVIHEAVHSIQHMDKEGKGDKYHGMEYLDRPDELEAFQSQIEYEADESGEDEAINYVEELVEYHEVPENEKIEKKRELLKNVI